MIRANVVLLARALTLGLQIAVSGMGAHFRTSHNRFTSLGVFGARFRHLGDLPESDHFLIAFLIANVDVQPTSPHPTPPQGGPGRKITSPSPTLPPRVVRVTPDTNKNAFKYFITRGVQ